MPLFLNGKLKIKPFQPPTIPWTIKLSFSYHRHRMQTAAKPLHHQQSHACSEHKNMYCMSFDLRTHTSSTSIKQQTTPFSPISARDFLSHDARQQPSS